MNSIIRTSRFSSLINGVAALRKISPIMVLRASIAFVQNGVKNVRLAALEVPVDSPPGDARFFRDVVQGRERVAFLAEYPQSGVQELFPGDSGLFFGLPHAITEYTFPYVYKRFMTGPE